MPVITNISVDISQCIDTFVIAQSRCPIALLTTHMGKMPLILYKIMRNAIECFSTPIQQRYSQQIALFLTKKGQAFMKYSIYNAI